VVLGPLEERKGLSRSKEVFLSRPHLHDHRHQKWKRFDSTFQKALSKAGNIQDRESEERPKGDSDHISLDLLK